MSMNNYVLNVFRKVPEPKKTTETVPAPSVKSALYQIREKVRQEQKPS